MMSFLKKHYQILLIYLASFIIFLPSLFVFFTNDDFYFLKITRQVSLSRFINYFNIFTKNQDGLGVYRPLTTQLFYLLKNPTLMHVIVFLTFFVILYLIYKLCLVLFKNKNIALVATFLYSVSATHFGHFYYLATYQEFGMTMFVLLMILLNIEKKYVLSSLCFVFALMSKETAIIAPFLLFLTDWYIGNKINYKKYLQYFIILGVYFFSHFYLYGLATGDTYIWNFGIRKLLNTVTWYLLWSFNLPESLVDFIGPGFKINPNLFLYWSKQIIPILILSFVQICFVVYILIKSKILNHKSTFLFCISWFLIALVPVLFLPQHKFSFYLTLPLVGIVFWLSNLLITRKTFFLFLFSCLWLFTSFLTLRFTYETNWITQSELVSKRVYDYLNIHKLPGINFIDTESDNALPFSPTLTVKTALSDMNFFYVFFPSMTDRVFYNGEDGNKINSRQFMGY